MLPHAGLRCPVPYSSVLSFSSPPLTSHLPLPKLAHPPSTTTTTTTTTAAANEIRFHTKPDPSKGLLPVSTSTLDLHLPPACLAPALSRLTHPNTTLPHLTSLSFLSSRCTALHCAALRCVHCFLVLACLNSQSLRLDPIPALTHAHTLTRSLACLGPGPFLFPLTRSLSSF